MTKIVSNRGTSSNMRSLNPSNWCGDSFKEFQKAKKSLLKFSQAISTNRGTSSVLARDIKETLSQKKNSILSIARGTSTRFLRTNRL